ncbi:hypothetical protein D3C87_1991080 [compost metagenome]
MNGLATKIPALLTRVSMRPKRSIVSRITCWATSGLPMSPATVRMSGSVDGLIEREVATTL